MRILYLMPASDADGAARQLTLLVESLPAVRFDRHVAFLGGECALSRHLVLAGAAVHLLGRPRWFDPRALWRLRRLIQDLRPDVVHACPTHAVRALAGVRAADRLVVSPGRPAGGLVTLADRRLLRKARCVVARGAAEVECLKRAGLSGRQLVLIPPAVRLTDPGTLRPPGLPPAARYLLCAGRMEPHKGFRDAIWAFDILRYLHDDLHLVLVGDGPDRGRLEAFTGAVSAGSQVHFLGPRAELAPLLAGAAVAWVPDLIDGGISVALEAMAAGTPVVASRLPLLSEMIAAGQTGYLVAPGDKIERARLTNMLLRDERLRSCLGRAGRQRAGQCFGLAALVAHFERLYQIIAA